MFPIILKALVLTASLETRAVCPQVFVNPDGIRNSSSLVIKGLPLAREIRSQVAARAKAFQDGVGRAPRLVGVNMGFDPATQVNTLHRKKLSKELWIDDISLDLPENLTSIEAKAEIDRIYQDESVDAILIHRPLPSGYSEEAVTSWIDPEKDADGHDPLNAGK
ncbi:MAG: tetrahydrofolate dehydrogenase/cyclohydrolase catalytic domain-containing protein [Bdellovibrionia bacterium]